MEERNAGGLYDNIRAVYRAEIAVPADKFDIRVIIEFDLLCVRDYKLLLGQIAADTYSNILFTHSSNFFGIRFSSLKPESRE